MRYIDIAEMRRIDNATAERAALSAGISDAEGHALLAGLAADGVAGAVSCIAGVFPQLRVIVVFGGGFNGADAVLAGIRLEQSGFDVVYYSAVDKDSLKGFARTLIDGKHGVDPESVVWPSDRMAYPEVFPMISGLSCVIIDGVLGIGAKSAPRGSAVVAIEWINRQRTRKSAYVVSVDVPSGMDADSGLALGAVVFSDLTICIGMPKKGFRMASALEYCGSVHVVEIGISQEDIGESEDNEGFAMVTRRDVANMLPRTARAAHKGDLGHVCVLGGSRGFIGAPALSGLGALRGGAGLVSVVTYPAAVAAVSAAAPEFMVRECINWTAGELSRCGLDFEGKTIVIGPGMGRSAGVAECVKYVLGTACAKHAVVDADALNAFAGDAEAFAGYGLPLVLTPHPGEAARLLGTTAVDVQNDREGAIKRLVALTGASVILKGAGTLVSAPGRGVYKISCGNPGMACGGGVGDVLAGLCGALLARGLPPFDAACASAWLHAAAGDEASTRRRGRAICATDIADCISVDL